MTELRYLQETLGDSTENPPKPVALHVSGALTTGVSPGQQSAINFLVENEAQIHKAVRDAIYQYYKAHYSTYQQAWSMGAGMFGGGDFSDVLPPIKTGTELDALVQISTIYIHPSDDEMAAIGIECAVPWDEEHGIGIRLSGTEVADIDTAHVAYPRPSID